MAIGCTYTRCRYHLAGVASSGALQNIYFLQLHWLKDQYCICVCCFRNCVAPMASFSSRRPESANLGTPDPSGQDNGVIFAQQIDAHIYAHIVA